jgi:hypothetical protein
MGAECDTSPEQVSETPQDSNPSWDTDGDSFSNAVEMNNANDHLFLDPDVCDENNSLALGLPCSTMCGQAEGGSIAGAVNLVDQGPGYYHYLGTDVTDTDDWGVLRMICLIEAGGRLWDNSSWCPPRIGIGDLSLGGGYYGGGYWVRPQLSPERVGR